MQKRSNKTQKGGYISNTRKTRKNTSIKKTTKKTQTKTKTNTKSKSKKQPVSTFALFSSIMNK